MKKTTTKKSPTGAPLGNPFKFFREGGEKTKAMFKNGGYNVPKNSLPKKYNGGPGSGMGRMAADDAAFDAMMATSPTPPASPDTTMRSMFPNPPIPTPGSRGELPTTPGHLNMKPSNYRNKKGGSVKRKKK